MAEVWVIFENKRGRDQMLEVWATNDGAETRCNELDAAHPNSDGFYIQREELHGA